MEKDKPVRFETNPIAGARDFHPVDMRLRNYITGKWHQASRDFGFVEYDAPILEPFAMYARKGGEELRDQMYTFEDRTGTLLTLRPEMTPSLVRLVQQRRKNYIMPLKWYSVPQCWRYETLTRGRKREFYQWNVDVLGVSTPVADAEVIAVAVHALELFGFTAETVEVRVSSRKLVQALLRECGIEDGLFEETCIVVDKMEKLSQDDLLAEFAKIGVDEERAAAVIDAMGLEELDDIRARFPSTADAIAELETVFATLDGYGYRPWCRFDAKIIRGLAYYTGVVFEATSKCSALRRAICGGGRYDKLFTSLGADTDLAAAGFGMGDCVLGELLVEQKLLPAGLLDPRVPVCVIPLSEAFRPQAMRVARLLREDGIGTDLLISRVRNMRTAFSYADRAGAVLAVLVAESEWERNAVVLKQLRAEDNKQREVSLDSLCAEVKALI